MEPSTQLTDILETSPCPFARRGRFCLAGVWDSFSPCAAELATLAKHLRDAPEGRPEERPDVLAVFAKEPRGAGTVELGRFLLRTIAGLRREIDGPDARPVAAEIESDLKGWDFRCGNAQYFVPVFASFYPADHVRQSRIGGWTYVLFQPEWAFRRFGISSRRRDREGLSRRVREVFVASGVTYALDSVLTWPKVLRYIKPVDEGEGPVTWWC